MSFIELNPWRKAINFGVEMVKARFTVDGGPEQVLAMWAPTRIPVPVGRHTVEMWCRWGINQNMGRNSIEVDVPPGGARVSWRSPGTAFSKGKMAVEAPGDPALATGYVVVEGAPGAAPPGWLTDPSGRHQLRYWDGVAWTPHVSDNGVASQDV